VVRPQPTPFAERHPASVTKVVAGVALVMIGMDVPLGHSISTSAVAALALLPVWCAAPRHYPGSRWVFLLTVASLAAGSVLALLPSNEHDVDPRNAYAMAVRMLAIVGGFGVLLWSRYTFHLETVVLLYGSGSLLSGVLDIPGSLNPWKYQLATPVTLIVLALLQRSRSRLPSVVALLLLALVLVAGVSVVNDYRSFFGFTVLTAALVTWQALRKPASTGEVRERGLRAWLTVTILLTAAAYALYSTVTALLLTGALGARLQAQADAQVLVSGSLLAGGRPEWSATRVLLGRSPAGFGLGAVPTPSDVLAAKGGLVTVGVSPDNGYVDHYMFGGQFRLHSILADAWSSFGWTGVLLVVVIGLLIVRALVTGLLEGTASPTAILLAMLALWDLGFGPIYSDFGEVMFALGIVLHPRDAREGAHDLRRWPGRLRR